MQTECALAYPAFVMDASSCRQVSPQLEGDPDWSRKSTGTEGVTVIEGVCFCVCVPVGRIVFVIFGVRDEDTADCWGVVVVITLASEDVLPDGG